MIGAPLRIVRLTDEGNGGRLVDAQFSTNLYITSNIRVKTYYIRAIFWSARALDWPRVNSQRDAKPGPEILDFDRSRTRSITELRVIHLDCTVSAVQIISKDL